MDILHPVVSTCDDFVHMLSPQSRTFVLLSHFSCHAEGSGLCRLYGDGVIGDGERLVSGSILGTELLSLGTLTGQGRVTSAPASRCSAFSLKVLCRPLHVSAFIFSVKRNSRGQPC